MPRFVIEIAEKKSGPWTAGEEPCPAAGPKRYWVAKDAYTNARAIWTADPAVRPWVRIVRHPDDSAAPDKRRAVHLFRGGRYVRLVIGGKESWQSEASRKRSR